MFERLIIRLCLIWLGMTLFYTYLSVKGSI